MTNCVGALASNGYNLEDGTGCGFTATGDISDTDPLIGPLTFDSGPSGLEPATWVHPLLRGREVIYP